jgi:hypothetical protein
LAWKYLISSSVGMHMPNRMGNAGTAILIGALATVSLVVATNGVAHAADNCLSGPKGAAPKGSHWYYRIDQATKRNCWYVRAEGEKPVASRSSSVSPASPAAETSLQPSVANARAEAGPAELGPSNAAAPMPASSAEATADDPQSMVASRWLDGPRADSQDSPAPAPADSGPGAHLSTPAGAAAPLAAAKAPPTSRSTVQTLLLAIVGALAFAGFLVGAIYKFGSARQNDREDIRSDRRAPWDSIEVDATARSAPHTTENPAPRIDAAREPREAIIPNEIAQLLSKLSREAAA